ncbi:hypothetical protein U1Q18_051659 [Sarracenia purpurea var. burkii]
MAGCAKFVELRRVAAAAYAYEYRGNGGLKLDVGTSAGSATTKKIAEYTCSKTGKRVTRLPVWTVLYPGYLAGNRKPGKEPSITLRTRITYYSHFGVELIKY